MRRFTTTLTKLLAALATATLVLAACGDDDDTSSPDETVTAPADSSGEDAGTDTDTDSDGGDAGPVTIVDFDYAPKTVTAAAGDEVSFTNEDGTAHTVTAEDNSFNSGSIGAGESGVVTAPDAPGDYAFFCAFHPFMTGTLVVE